VVRIRIRTKCHGYTTLVLHICSFFTDPDLFPDWVRLEQLAENLGISVSAAVFFKFFFIRIRSIRKFFKSLFVWIQILYCSFMLTDSDLDLSLDRVRLEQLAENLGVSVSSAVFFTVCLIK
jgi:hypothetical protein